MATQYDDGDFTTAQPNGADRTDRPFVEQGDSATQVIYRPMLVNKNDYVPLPLDTPHPTVTDAYLVGEDSFEDYGAGLMSFQRIYANIPVEREGVYTGTQAYTYPGMNTNGNTEGTDRSISSITVLTDVLSRVSCSNSVEIGSVVYISASWTGPVGVTFNGFRTALEGTTRNSVVVSLIPAGETFDEGTLTELTYEPRGQRPELTGSITDFTYYLPGITDGITLPTDVKESSVFAPFDAETGQSTSILTSLTIPNFSSYQALVDASAYILLNSKITRWKGNILQRANVKVRAL